MSVNPAHPLYSAQMASKPTHIRASVASQWSAPQDGAVMSASSVEFTTIEAVELFAVGRWFPWTTSKDGQENGTTITQADLQAAVDAAGDPEVQAARIKIGHTDPRFNDPQFDGEPAYGSLSNLRLSDDGMTLLGDYSFVPKSLADIMHSAYPARSVEASFNHKTPSGKTYGLVITAVSLLGASAPAVTCLEDITENGLFTMSSKLHDKLMAASAVDTDTIRRGYYEQLTSEQMWWWIRSIHVDPAELIVDNDDGQLYRVPYTASNGEVSYGEPVAVDIEYVDKPKDAVKAAARLAAASGRPMAIFATRSESRPTTNTNQEEGMDPKLIRSTLGLAEDATDEQVLARMTELNGSGDASTGDDTGTTEVPATTPAEVPAPTSPEQPASPTPTPPAAPDVPEGMVLMDQTMVDELKVAAGRANQLYAAQQVQQRDTFLDSAIKAGKFAPSRKAHFAKLYDADPEGAKELVTKLEAGSVPLTEVGVTGDGGHGGEAKEAYPNEWFPELAARSAGGNTHNGVTITQGG